MANCCFTKMRIVSEEKEQLHDLYEKIMSWAEQPFYEGAHKNWLGNIAGNSGICDNPRNPEELRCRGDLIDASYDTNREISLCTDTAWVPMLKMWRLIVEKYLPDATISYTAEEPGCGIFWTNDEDIVGKYFLDVWEHENIIGEPCYAMEENALAERIRRVTGSQETDIRSLIAIMDEQCGDCYSLNQWTFVPLEDCD